MHCPLWHYGLKKALFNSLPVRKVASTLLPLNVNIDGVPMFKSFWEQFSPILVNVKEILNMAALTDGMFCGKSNYYYYSSVSLTQ